MVLFMNQSNFDINTLALAYLGDAYYELLVRNYLIQKGIYKVKNLQEESLKFVSAKSQAKILTKLLEANFFKDYEIEIIKNGRNAKTHSKPKSCDILTYKHATAFECIIGYYYLTKNFDRMNELFEVIIGL